MPRSRRVAPGGYVYHVLNRGVGRRRLFYKPRDYEAFEEIVEETLLTRPTRICGFCLMPNHWHNEPQHETEVKSLRKCVVRGQPLGSDSWVAVTADQLGLQYTLRNRGRPAKPTETKPGR